MTEPNRIAWTHDGYPCLMHKNSFGAWCGYVAVPPCHPWFELRCEDVPAVTHGRVSYAAHCQGHICHEAEPGTPEPWWVGFCCAYEFDEGPDGGFVRDVEYVRGQVLELVRQAKEQA